MNVINIKENIGYGGRIMERVKASSGGIISWILSDLQTNIEDVSMKQVVTENWARRGTLVTSPLQLNEGDYLVRVDDTGNDSTVIVESVYNNNPGLGFTYKFVTENHTTGEQFFADEQQVRARGECVFYETVGQKRDKN